MAAQRLLVRRFSSALVLAAFLAAIPFGSASAADPVEVNVLLPLTGSVALVGQSAQSALLTLQEAVNKAGGIAGRPLKFVISDDQSNPNIAVQLANRIILTKPAVILGSNLSATCSAIAPLLKDGPVDMCFSPGIHPEEGSFVFSPAPSTLDPRDCYGTLREETRLEEDSVHFSTDGSGSTAKKSSRRPLLFPSTRM